jgi:hypothetical protein
MREELRQFIDGLSREEQMEIVHTLVAQWSVGVTEDRPFVNADGVAVGFFVPVAKWLEEHPRPNTCIYKNSEEAYEAAKNGRSPSEIVAWLNANYPAEPGPSAGG